MYYNNPVNRGFFPDPSVVRVGNDYYMVNSTFQYFPAIAISHSTDLVHWHIIGYGVTNSDYLDLSHILDSRGIWAPDISYHNGRFYIFATLRHNDECKPMRSQMVISSERPEGPYTKPVFLDVDAIDPSHFIDDDGKHYMITDRGLCITPLNDDCTQIIGDTVKVWDGTGERCCEGPHILKHNGYYYAIVAEGGTGYGHGINVARSGSLFGPYEPSPYNPVMRQFDPNHPIQRTGHGKLVQTQNGDWWCTYLCGRPNAHKYTTIGRESALDPVTWTDDNWFVINNGNGPSTTQTAPDLPRQIYTKCPLDHFNDKALDMQWIFVRNPDYNNLSLSENPGHLRIYTQKGTLNQICAKNTVVRREQELQYHAYTKLLFNPCKKGLQAGLTCYYSTAAYIRFGLCYNDGRELQLVINRNNGEELITSVKNIPTGYIYLKVSVNHLTRSFYYSLDGEEWIPVHTLEHCIYLCDEGVPNDRKRHTGTLVGLYANSGDLNDRIPADFDLFFYMD